MQGGLTKYPKIVQERLVHASIQITLDTYSHITPGLQEAAAARFDDLVMPKSKSEAKNGFPEKVR
jgi:integrase